MSTATITLTTSYQRLSTLMDAAGFNISNLKRDVLSIRNASSTETVTIVFGADSATAATTAGGMPISALDGINVKNVDIGRAWIKTSTASDIAVSDEDIEYHASNRPYTGVSDNGTTTTISQPLTLSKATTNTPVALTSSATIALDASLGNYFYYTSGHTSTINVTNLAAGQTIKILIISDGTSRTQTFGTGLTSTGTLATGTDATKGFIVAFTRISGTKGIEDYRTGALVV